MINQWKVAEAIDGLAVILRGAEVLNYELLTLETANEIVATHNVAVRGQGWWYVVECGEGFCALSEFSNGLLTKDTFSRPTAAMLAHAHYTDHIEAYYKP